MTQIAKGPTLSQAISPTCQRHPTTQHLVPQANERKPSHPHKPRNNHLELIPIASKMEILFAKI
jgi:hypothetical protein